jgi:hypothetical protein
LKKTIKIKTDSNFEQNMDIKRSGKRQSATYLICDLY